MNVRLLRVGAIVASIILTDTIPHFSDEETEVKNSIEGFPGGAVVESLPANAGDTGSSPGLGRSHMPRSN